ncbi:MAG: flavin reductase family protein [Alphaproteobacteria bacterium]|jgi:flavin reductase (DIM6/NTAB) family NADH-FMN oxidoreductase RutF|nr:flavin reductase family protein [Alphaproteobacteria bacterium]
MYIDVDEGMRPPPLKHSPFKALVVPRPIGWVTTMSAEGVLNLAPYSYFNAVCDAPPCVMYCVNGAHKEGGAKDSLRNVEETGEFVCNLVTWELREVMNLTSENLPRSVDEMAKVGLTAAASVKVKPPRVAESPAHFECRYVQTVDLPSTHGARHAMVIGEVVALHVADELVVDGLVDVRKLKPVARLGYMDYAVVEDFFTMERPD